MTGPVRTAPVLRRTLGFSLLTLYGLGTNIGGGIYVLIGGVAAYVLSEEDLRGKIVPVQITWAGPWSMQGSPVKRPVAISIA